MRRDFEEIWYIMYKMISQVQMCVKGRKGYVLSLYWHMEDILFLMLGVLGGDFLLHVASPIFPDGISGYWIFLVWA